MYCVILSVIVLLTRQTAALHTHSRNRSRTTGVPLPGARRCPCAACPPPAPLITASQRAGCHAPASTARATTAAPGRTCGRLPPLPVPDNTLHEPGAPTPALHWRQVPPGHIRGWSPAYEIADRSCPVRPGRAGACPVARPFNPGSVRSRHQMHATYVPPLPVWRPPRRPTTGGRGAFLLLRADHSSTRWCCAGCAGEQVDRVAHQSGAASGAPAGSGGLEGTAV